MRFKVIFTPTVVEINEEDLEGLTLEQQMKMAIGIATDYGMSPSVEEVTIEKE